MKVALLYRYREGAVKFRSDLYLECGSRLMESIITSRFATCGMMTFAAGASGRRHGVALMIWNPPSIQVNGMFETFKVNSLENESIWISMFIDLWSD